jgi:UDP-N-acetylmuramate--alanine ligase
MLEGLKRVHFVGIGGIGMSGIAEVLLSYGYSVSGSDLKKSPITERLKSLGADIHIGHKKENIEDPQAVVFSSAVKTDNPEIREAHARKIPVIQRGQMLSEILNRGFSIAVTGAHGKTTTTAMVAKAIKTPKINPTVIIGGKIKGLSKNAILGRGKFFVAEADESDGSFQKIRPNIAVITNMDREHMDYYGNLEAMEEAYKNFMNGVAFDGLIAACGDDPKLDKILKGVERRIVRYGIGRNNDICASSIKQSAEGSVFKVKKIGRPLGQLSIPAAGIHNVLNSLAACAVGLELGISFKKIALNLKDFEGIERRMEIKGEADGVTFVDDYAHHPTEIISTLKAARHIWDGRRFVVLFQPHRYSRVKDLKDRFAKAFTDADLVFVTDIYSAGEKPIKNITSAGIVRSLRSSGKKTFEIESWREEISKVKEQLKPGDVVFSLGAGDITKFYEHFAGA